MKRLSIWLLALLLMQAAATGCENDKFDKSIYETEPGQLNEVGQWIHDNYVVPYNIEVQYRWRDMETNLTLNITPPDQNDVVPFLKMLHTGWISTYMELCGRQMMKPIFPKQVQLFGSGGYNPVTSGVTQGSAEGGKKLILYALNDYDSTDRESVKYYVRIPHHECGHLLNQAKEYSLAFKKITPSSYSPSGGNRTKSAAHKLGFVTPYGSTEPDEDFVETLAEYVTDTPEEWAALLEDAVVVKGTSRDMTAQQYILKKTDMVRTYMKENYGVDIDVLRALVLQRIDDVVAGNYQ